MSLDLNFNGTRYTGNAEGRARSSYGGNNYSYSISLLENHKYQFGISWSNPSSYPYTQYYYRLYLGSSIVAYAPGDAGHGSPTGGFTYRSTNDQNYSLRLIGYGDYTISVNSIDIPNFNDGDAVFGLSDTSPNIGQELSIEEYTADPDGTGTLSYSWQTSADNSSWSEVGTSATYTVDAS